MLEPPVKPLLAAAEQRAVDELKERVRALSTSDTCTLSSEVIEEFLRDGSSRRFSRAKSFDVETAFAAAKSTLEFRTKVSPAKIRPEDIPLALPSGCWRWAGHAKDGRPIILVRYVAAPDDTLPCRRSHADAPETNTGPRRRSHALASEPSCGGLRSTTWTSTCGTWRT